MPGSFQQSALVRWSFRSIPLAVSGCEGRPYIRAYVALNDSVLAGICAFV
jgi:hypothetical protein